MFFAVIDPSAQPGRQSENTAPDGAPGSGGWGRVTGVSREDLDAWPRLEGQKLEGPLKTNPGQSGGPCLSPASAAGRGNSTRDTYKVCRGDR